MPLVEEEIPIQTEVLAATGEGVTRTAATRNPNLYERYLELPVPVVLLTLWLAGVALIGLGALPLYQLFWAVLKTLAGA
jgi:hypothetical protein